MTSRPQPTLDRIKTLLRRDLKLGAATDIPDDMPLVGGPLDLDSLDVLMVITSIEKEFGITSLAEAGGREVFASVAALAAFVEQHEAASPSGDMAPTSTHDLHAALASLPHAPPFRFLSQVTALTPGVTADGLWQLDGSEAFFTGHFPGRPIVPGVLIAEALAQLSGIVLAAPGPTDNCNIPTPAIGKLGRVEVRFLHPVTPPATLTLHTTLTRQIGDAAVFTVQASVGDTPVAEGSLWLSVPTPQPERPSPHGS